MNKIQGYDEAQAYTGESRALPAGKYICEIKGAKEVKAKTGKKQLVLQLDIAEGEYKDFYSDQFSLLKKRGRRQSGTTEDFSDKDTRVNNYRFSKV